MCWILPGFGERLCGKYNGASSPQKGLSQSDLQDSSLQYPARNRGSAHITQVFLPHGFDFVVMRELTGGLYFGERKTYIEQGLRTAVESPNIFSVRITSNCFGSRTICIAQLSTSISESYQKGAWAVCQYPSGSAVSTVKSSMSAT